MRQYPWNRCERITDLRDLVRHSAKMYQNRTAFRQKRGEGVESYSFLRLRDDIDALGTALLARGFAGRHIALIGENSYEWVVSYLAVVCGVGVVVPLDKETTREEIETLLRASDASAVICSESFFSLMDDVRTRVRLAAVIGIGGTGTSNLLSLNSLLEEGRELLRQGERRYVDQHIDPQELRVILYTSGTTGKSKGVMLCHKNIASVVWGALSAVRVRRTALSVLPIHHSYESSCCIFGAMHAGVTVSFNDSLKYLRENLALFRPHMLILVPLFVETMYRRIIEDAKRSGREETLRRAVAFSNRLLRIGLDLRPLLFRQIRKGFGGRLNFIICGGAPLSAELVARFRDLGITVLNGYGITECAPLVSVNRNRYYDDGSVGVPIPCCRVRIHEPDETGEGEILVQGDNVMMGYYKDPEQTKAAFVEGGWFRTGDLGRLDGELLRVTGRKKNTIILSNGKNVQPEEIEEFISVAIPYVKEVIVYASDENEERQLISAIVVPDMDYVEKHKIADLEKTLHADIHTLNRRLPTFKQVNSVRLQLSDFEKTSTKKIKRFLVLGEVSAYARES